MEEQLVALLLSASPALTALIGDRIRPVILDQTDALPAITYRTMSGIRGYTMSGPDGLVNYRVQIDCWGETFLHTKTIGRNVITALSNQTVFQGCFVLNEDDTFEDHDGKRIYRTRLDFQIFSKGF